MPSWRWTNLLSAGVICPLFKTQLRKATLKPYICTVRETHSSRMSSVSAPPLTPDLILDVHTLKPGLSGDCYCPVIAGLRPGRGAGAGARDHPLVGQDKGTWLSSGARHRPPRSWLGHRTPSHNPWGEAQGGVGRWCPPTDRCIPFRRELVGDGERKNN